MTYIVNFIILKTSQMKAWQIYSIVLCYLCLCTFGIIHHEMWLDEAHHILLAKKSNSLAQLFFNARYEGHPKLWNILIYITTQFFENPISISILHIGISTTSIYLICKYAPFNKIAILSIVFGYFMAYEYAIIARNYALCIFLLLLLLVQLTKSNPKLLLISILIVLLCNSHLFACFIVLGLLPTLLPIWKTSTFKIKMLSFFLVFTGFILAIVQIIPPDDHFWGQYNNDNLISFTRLSKAAKIFLMGIFPSRNMAFYSMLNTNQVEYIFKWLAPIITIALSVTPFILLKKNKPSVFLFYTVAICSTTIFYFTPLMITARNCGFLSVALFSSVWLYRYNIKSPQTQTYNRLNNCFFGSILFFQVISGLSSYYLDIKLPFSNAKIAANYINNYLLKTEIPILLSHHSAGPALTLYSKKPIFYLESSKYGSYCEWNIRPFMLDDKLLLEKLKSQLLSKKQCILIMNNDVNFLNMIRYNNIHKIIPTLKTIKIAEFTGSIINSENYYIHLIWY